MTTHAYEYGARMRLVDKLVLLAALAIAAALFLSIGWVVAAPTDPHGAVSLVVHTNPVWMAVQTAILAAVAAAIATVMIGRKLADVGLFASALGLAFLTLRGQTAAYLLLYISSGDRGAERALAGKLALEAVIWTVVLLVCMAVSALVLRWCFGDDAGGASGDANSRNPGSGPGRRVHLGDMAISEVPALAALVGGGAPGESVRTPIREGLKATGITALLAMFLFAVLSSGSQPQKIQHGQIWFATFAAFYIGVWVSKSWFPCRTAFWRLLAVPLACVAGYLWAMVRGGSGGRYAHLANVPLSDFLRALPLTFMAIGCIGVLVAHWSITEGALRSESAKTRSSNTARKR